MTHLKSKKEIEHETKDRPSGVLICGGIMTDKVQLFFKAVATMLGQPLCAKQFHVIRMGGWMDGWTDGRRNGWAEGRIIRPNNQRDCTKVWEISTPPK